MGSFRHEFEQEWEDEFELESELEFELSTEIEYKIGDPAGQANQGQDPNPYHDVVLAQIASHMQSSKWGDIRREQPQVAGGISNPVNATALRRDGGTGLNFPDLQGVDLGDRRAHIEIDTSAARSRAHQRRIFAADASSALGGAAGQARGVFVVINPRTGLVTSVRHVRHRQGGAPVVSRVRYGAGVPIATLLRLGVLDSPVSSQSPDVRAAMPARRPRRQRQREFEGEWLYYL
jgi:hypothetical protein